jgi:hypothetical protein
MFDFIFVKHCIRVSLCVHGQVIRVYGSRECKLYSDKDTYDIIVSRFLALRKGLVQ